MCDWNSEIVLVILTAVERIGYITWIQDYEGLVLYDRGSALQNANLPDQLINR